MITLHPSHPQSAIFKKINTAFDPQVVIFMNLNKISIQYKLLSPPCSFKEFSLYLLGV
jgi:hypothetical protein